MNALYACLACVVLAGVGAVLGLPGLHMTGMVAALIAFAVAAHTYWTEEATP